MPAPFEEIELPRKLARVWELLLEGRTLPEIALVLTMSRTALTSNLVRLAHELRRALPAETTTYHHLLAQEFMRRQQAILTGAVSAERQPRADPRLDSYRFFVSGRALSAKA